MRIISGTKRGMLLKAPEGMDTRPTSDRAREALFNIIAPYVAGCDFLDLFSGSGAVGTEALSRGAEKAYFVENSSADIIKLNLQKAGFEKNAKVFKSDVFSFLNTTEEKFDIIFLDPPYHKGFVEKALDIIGKKNMLKDGGTAVAECDFDEALPAEISGLMLFDRRKYGRAILNFYKK